MASIVIVGSVSDPVGSTVRRILIWGANGDHYLDHSPKDSGNPLIEKHFMGIDYKLSLCTASQ